MRTRPSLPSPRTAIVTLALTAVILSACTSSRAPSAPRARANDPVDEGLTGEIAEQQEGVDVSLIADRARSVGLSAFEPVTQQAALRALGHDRWQQTMQAAQTELQRAGRNSEAVRVWEERSRASLLTDLSRFGGFWWLVLATEGLPEPPWLARARAHAERPEVR